MELLKDNPTLSIPELAEKIKKSESAVEKPFENCVSPDY